MAAPAPAKSWLPVESNPDVFNAYAKRLGWPTDRFAFTDLLSLDAWATDMLPRPVRAVAMLFPIVPAHEAAAAARAAAAAPLPAAAPFFVRQEIANACGTIALLHAVAASAAPAGGDVPLAPGSFFEKYFAKALRATPDERAALLGEDEEIEVEQAAAVAGGQSDVIDDTWQHFVCFVERGGRLWELDGRQPGPVDHGPTADLLADAIRVMREYMARDPAEVRFTMLALCPPMPEDE